MKIKTLNAIKFDGTTHPTGTTLDVGEFVATRLEEKGAALILSRDNTKKTLDGHALYIETEDFHTLRVEQLKAICVYLDISSRGRKEDIILAIEEQSQETIELDAMDRTSLMALAEEETITLDPDASIEEIRDTIEKAMT